jgi:microcystin degradation protein MlrC
MPALIAYRTYPHIDQHERALQGAELLERAMQGEIRPKTVIARRPMIYGLDHGRTQQGPMAELIARGEAIEHNGAALAVSICAGFSRANIRDVGPSVTVTVDGNTGRAQAIAEEFMDHVWETRDFTTVKLLPRRGVDGARAARQTGRQAARCRRLPTTREGGYGDALPPFERTGRSRR